MKRFARIIAAFGFVAAVETEMRAQDIFEIQVYEYETVPKGRWNLETHLIHIARGKRTAEGSVAPTDQQSHLSFELTRGINNEFEMAGYLLIARRPNGGVEFAGTRLRPRIRAPESWKLPVDISLSIEIGFPRPQYEANSVTLELRPIIEKTFSRCRLSFNPVLARALRGPDTKEGFEFEPGAKIAYFLKGKDRFNVGMEYYGATGAITHFLPANEQVHIFFPSADIFLNEHAMINLGVGVGVTDSGERLIFKSRFGYLF
ncbi:MAG TPA: hypothetical protein VGQ81_12855 [Acidobacteriota bacterium]|jgi:hypothetical protein|nr:hypothetical protein [Acidobacteriota bacterium]